MCKGHLFASTVAFKGLTVYMLWTVIVKLIDQAQLVITPLKSRHFWTNARSTDSIASVLSLSCPMVLQEVVTALGLMSMFQERASENILSQNPQNPPGMHSIQDCSSLEGLGEKRS